MCRVLIVDHDAYIRRGLVSIVAEHPSWKVVAEARDGREGIDLALSEKPDVVVLEVTLPEVNGLAATRKIVSALPRTSVLLFTTHAGEQVVREGLAAGARGYVLKTDAAASVAAAIGHLARFETFFSPSVSEILARLLAKSAAPDDHPAPLTPRQREVLHLTAEGLTRQHVAQRLGIGLKTLETHYVAIRYKLKVDSVAAMVRYALRNNLVTT